MNYSRVVWPFRACRCAAFLAVLPLAVPACGGDKSGEQSPRDRAIQDAKKSYEVAVSQGVDLSRTPCLDQFGPWVVVVVSDRKRPLRTVVVEECGAATRRSHFVALDLEGRVLAAR
jgi:hypothetical protein